ncbi:MAG: phosphotransferase family protein, partial [Novosphingobium sp.]|nr:phosphotransferase family protein [Novosphingobium sp.]
MSDVIVAPETRDLEDLARSIGQWLGSKMPAASDIRIDNLTYPRGAGQSHETILFDAHWKEGGVAKDQGCVVRIKPGKFTVFPDNLFDEQYQVMKVLHENSHVTVAKPLWFEKDASVLGSPFFVMEKKQGRVPVSIPPYAREGWLSVATPEQRRKLWENAVDQLAAVQLVPLDKVQFLAGPDHARDGLAQEWDKYTRFVDWLEAEEKPYPVLHAAMDRLKSIWPKNQPEGMV